MAEESLTARMGLDTDGYARDLKKAEGITGRAAKRMAGMFAGVLSVAGIVALGKSAMEMADRIGNAADRLGITTDAVQDFINAARAAGIEMGVAEMALQRWTRRLAEAQQGKGELVGILSQYNIQLRDANGKARDGASVLRDYANAVKGAESKQEQLRMAFKAFDSEGADLVRILKDGAEGLDEFTRIGNEKFGKFTENATRELQAAKLEVEAFKDSLTIDFGNIIVDFKSKEGLTKLGYGLFEQAAKFAGMLADAVYQGAAIVGAVFPPAMETIWELIKAGFGYVKDVGEASFAYLFDVVRSQWKTIALAINISLLDAADTFLGKLEKAPWIGKKAAEARKAIRSELDTLKQESQQPDVVKSFGERIGEVKGVAARMVAAYDTISDKIAHNLASTRETHFADEWSKPFKEGREEMTRILNSSLYKPPAPPPDPQTADSSSEGGANPQPASQPASQPTKPAEPSGLKPVTVHRGISGEIINWDALTPEQRAALAGTRYANDPRRSARVAALRGEVSDTIPAASSSQAKNQASGMAKDIAELKKATQSIEEKFSRMLGPQ